MKRIMSFLIVSLITLSLFSCGDVQDNYTEIHTLVYEGVIIYYVLPGDGESSISRNRMNVDDTVFIYIYNAEDFETFSYNNFFSPLGEYQMHKDSKTEKLYILNTDDIDQLIYQHSMDYDQWKANQPS